jgi:hypothetical protein
MKRTIILTAIAALISGETVASDPNPGTRFSELSGMPASPHQRQVLGVSRNKPERAGFGRFDPVDSDPESGTQSSPTYKGLPASPHQLKVLKRR